MGDRSWHIHYLGGESTLETLDILREASVWTSTFGAPAWPLETLTAQELGAVVAAGEQVGGFEGAAMGACMRLQGRDCVHWPDDRPGEALYLHKLAVRRAAAGTGWPRRMVDWAAAECRNRGAHALRLDTVPDTQLPALYEDLGFRLVDDVARCFAGRRLVRMELLLGTPRGISG